MFRNFRYFSAAIILASIAFITIPAAQAVVISSGTITPGFSKDNQNADGSSNLGAAIELNLSFTKNSDTSGQWSATINNIGNGVITVFGLSLNEDYAWNETGFTFDPITTACLSDKKFCNWSSGDATQITSDFLSNVTLGAEAENPSPFRGIEEGEIMELIWDVTGDFTSITAATQFSELVSPNFVNGSIVDFNSFWAAHVQVLANGQSDKIGGSVTIQAPAPDTIALFGIGLIGVALAIRRRRIGV